MSACVPGEACGCAGPPTPVLLLPLLLQVKKCADAGADIVRITVQSMKEAEASAKIREQLFKEG